MAETLLRSVVTDRNCVGDWRGNHRLRPSLWLGAAILGLSLISVALPAAADDQINRRQFEAMIAARIGDGTPLHTVSHGTLFARDDGRVLAIMQGYGHAIAVRPDPEATEVLSIGRGILLFLDPKDRSILAVYPPLASKAAPQGSVSRYGLEDGGLKLDVAMVREGEIRRMDMSGGANCRDQDRLVICQKAITVADPAGTAFETYTWTIDPEATSLASKYRTAFLKVGSSPPNVGGGVESVMQLSIERVAGPEALPPEMAKFLAAESPEFATPFADPAESMRAMGFPN